MNNGGVAFDTASLGNPDRPPRTDRAPSGRRQRKPADTLSGERASALPLEPRAGPPDSPPGGSAGRAAEPTLPAEFLAQAGHSPPLTRVAGFLERAETCFGTQDLLTHKGKIGGPSPWKVDAEPTATYTGSQASVV